MGRFGTLPKCQKSQENLRVSGCPPRRPGKLACRACSTCSTRDQRFQFRSNIESKVTKFLTLGSQTFALFQNDAMGNVSDAFTYLRATTPGIIPQYGGKYGYAQISEENQQANNVFSFLNNRLGKDQTSRFNTTLYATATIRCGPCGLGTS